MQQTSLGDYKTNWVLVKAERVTGQGTVAPRLRFQMLARTPRERMQVQIHLMRGELAIEQECLGDGILTGIPLEHGERSITLEIPVSRAALDYIEAISPADQIHLELRLTGWLRGKDNNEDGRHALGEPQPGEWVFQHFGEAQQTTLNFEVARSDWFTRVLQPIGTVQYISTEIKLPAGDPMLRTAVNQIGEAERAYANGNDPAVFLHCRAAIDALPGAKQEIFANVPDKHEAKTLDNLMRQAGNYFHLGRHVAIEGEDEGIFPVNHRDARFALNLAKLLIAHTSDILSTTAHTAQDEGADLA
jgi:hypothetical protein